jgi:hypothetical protein
LTVTLRQLTPAEIDHELIWGGIAVLVLGVARWFPFAVFPPPRCPLKMLTGYPCCTCGLTRSLLAFAHGEVVAAFTWNPLVALCALGSVVYALYAAIVLVFGLPRVRWSLTAFWERVVVRLLAVAVIVANWAYLVAVGR